MIDKSMPRPFLMVYSARPGRIGASDVIYERAARPYYRVDVADTRHLDFSDMAFWGGPLRQRPVLGTIAPARVNEITGVIVRQYFDQELLGRRSPLLAGTNVSRKSACGHSRRLRRFAPGVAAPERNETRAAAYNRVVFLQSEPVQCGPGRGFGSSIEGLRGTHSGWRIISDQVDRSPHG